MQSFLQLGRARLAEFVLIEVSKLICREGSTSFARPSYYTILPYLMKELKAFPSLSHDNATSASATDIGPVIPATCRCVPE